MLPALARELSTEEEPGTELSYGRTGPGGYKAADKQYPRCEKEFNFLISNTRRQKLRPDPGHFTDNHVTRGSCDRKRRGELPVEEKCERRR